MPRTYWMLTISAENFRITRAGGFSVQGFRASQRRKVERMEVGDRLLFYVTQVRRFAATATVTATYYEEHAPVWKASRAGEDFPYRVKLEPAVVLEEGTFLDARDIAPRMEYVKRWTPECWPLAFQGELHIIPRSDFALLEEEMKKAVAQLGHGQPSAGDHVPEPLPSQPPSL